MSVSIKSDPISPTSKRGTRKTRNPRRPLVSTKTRKTRRMIYKSHSIKLEGQFRILETRPLQEVANQEEKKEELGVYDTTADQV